ncbi:MAG: hypothetical protein K0V04_19500 [Deltaproteobacteria bacterium]|nr:hypothetical protein [Deltaproteobacteria bacterium]
MASAAPGGDVDAHLGEATRQLEQRQHHAAAQSFAAGYRGMTEAQQRGPVGQRAIALAYDAYREAWHDARDQGPLREGQALLGEHVEVLERAGQRQAAAETRANLAWLEHLLELEEQAAVEQVEPVACPEPLPLLVEPAPPDPTDPLEPGGSADPVDEPRSSRDPLGVALATAGGVVMVGGVGVLIGGTQVLPRARRQIESANRDPDNPIAQDSTYLDEHRRRGQTWMISGAVVAGVGAAALTWGIVRLVQRRNKRGSSGEPSEARGPVRDRLTFAVSPRAILLRARF